jgi:hypothetical protein
LLERDGRCYAYRLTAKGFNVALRFRFFHKRLCGPLANSESVQSCGQVMLKQRSGDGL